jgi:hypothetical protein
MFDIQFYPRILVGLYRNLFSDRVPVRIYPLTLSSVIIFPSKNGVQCVCRKPADLYDPGGCWQELF